MVVSRRVSAYRTLASESRVAILHLLGQRAEPLGVDIIAAAVGRHVNTVREHLDRLVASGFVAREPEVRTVRGRPRMLYRSVDRVDPPGDTRARDHLTRLMVAGYGRAVGVPAEAAEAAGTSWADRIVPPTAAPGGGATGAAAAGGGAAPDVDGSPDATWTQLAALEQHFEELGFEPEADPVALQVHLRRCPFYDLARERTEVVCSVHLGLARGVLANAGGPLTATVLEPFVGPRHCVLQLAL